MRTWIPSFDPMSKACRAAPGIPVTASTSSLGVYGPKTQTLSQGNVATSASDSRVPGPSATASAIPRLVGSLGPQPARLSAMRAVAVRIGSNPRFLGGLTLRFSGGPRSGQSAATGCSAAQTADFPVRPSYRLPFARLCVIQSIWQFLAELSPPLLHAETWSASISSSL